MARTWTRGVALSALMLCQACADADLAGFLTPLPNGTVVVVNGSLSDITSARLVHCEGAVRLASPLARTESPVAPGARWVAEVPGGCYRLHARTSAETFRSKPFDLPPSGAYRVVVREAG